MSSKKSTDTTSNTTQTTTPNVPDWFTQPTTTQAGNVTNLINQGPGAYTPGISGLQTQATDAAGNLTTSPYYGQAADALGGLAPVSADQVTGQSLLDNLGAYETSDRNAIVNPVLADYDTNTANTAAQQQAAAAQGGAFGGSRYGVAQAQAADLAARGRATTESGLLQNLYTTATANSSADAARRQAAMTSNQSADLAAAEANNSNALAKAGVLANLGSSSDADTRANIGVQAGLGGVQTDAENAIKQYPLTYAAQTEGLLSGLDPALFTGNTATGQSKSTSTTTDNPGLLGALGTAAQIGSLFVPGAGGLSAAAGMSGVLGKLFGGGSAAPVADSPYYGGVSSAPMGLG